jgi:hypothetical protein
MKTYGILAGHEHKITRHLCSNFQKHPSQAERALQKKQSSAGTVCRRGDPGSLRPAGGGRLADVRQQWTRGPEAQSREVNYVEADHEGTFF